MPKDKEHEEKPSGSEGDSANKETEVSEEEPHRVLKTKEEEDKFLNKRTEKIRRENARLKKDLELERAKNPKPDGEEKPDGDGEEEKPKPDAVDPMKAFRREQKLEKALGALGLKDVTERKLTLMLGDDDSELSIEESAKAIAEEWSEYFDPENIGGEDGGHKVTKEPEEWTREWLNQKLESFKSAADRREFTQKHRAKIKEVLYGTQFNRTTHEDMERSRGNK